MAGKEKMARKVDEQARACGGQFRVGHRKRIPANSETISQAIKVSLIIITAIYVYLRYVGYF